MIDLCFAMLQGEFIVSKIQDIKMLEQFKRILPPKSHQPLSPNSVIADDFYYFCKSHLISTVYLIHLPDRMKLSFKHA